MEYLLIIAFAIGLLLFLLGWLRVIIAGFMHHFITGIVSIIPVLNVLVLPSVWHQVYGWVMAGFIGLILAIATWFAGADKQVTVYAKQAGFNLPSPTTTSSSPIAASGDLPKSQQTVEVQLPTTKLSNTNSANTPATSNVTTTTAAMTTGKELPKSALFSMAYKTVETNQLGNYQGQYIRLTQKDRQRYEGKLVSVESNTLTIERRVNGGLFEHKVSFADIVSSEVMTRE